MKLSRAFLLALFAAGCSDSAQSPIAPEDPSANFGLSGLVWVTNSNDSGTGSFRKAVEQANGSSSVKRIHFRFNLAPIQLQSPVVFIGGQDLEIQGNGATLDGSALGSLETNFLANGGGDLEIAGLTVREAPGHGLMVQVPSGATGGIQKVVFRSFKAIDNMGHGVEINDQEDPEDVGNADPAVGPVVRGNSNGSGASVEVLVTGSLFKGNGFGEVDRDGLRINEGGLGNLKVSILLSRADDNGADGVELDERGEGSVDFFITGSHFARNGDFDTVPPIDKDDGVDVDELDAGDMTVRVLLSTFNDNFEEGLDLNENDAGDQRIDIRFAEFSRNLEEGLDLEEDDDWQGGGHLIASLVAVRADGNAGGDGGIKIRERGDGDVDADVVGSAANDNTTAGMSIREQGNGNLEADVGASVATGNTAEGIFVREQDAGNLDGEVATSTANDNNVDGVFMREDDAGDHMGLVRLSRADGNGDQGIDFDENNGGNLTAAVANTSASNNTGHGVRADEGGDGAGTLSLTTVTLNGNGSAGTTGNVPPTP